MLGFKNIKMRITFIVFFNDDVDCVKFIILVILLIIIRINIDYINVFLDKRFFIL